MKASLAFVFPCQGSQVVSMLADIGAAESVVTETFAEASAALGYDLWALCQQGPAEVLNQTDKTQPAILTASIALWRLWLAKGGLKPAYVAGHSLGEYSALVAAGSLTLVDAVRLVERRGQLMQEAVPAGTGGMAAVLGLDDADVRLRLSPDTLPPALQPLLSRREEEYYILALEEYSQLEHVMAVLRIAGSQVLEMQVFQPDLEEVFVKIMGDVEIRDAAAVPIT